MTSKDHLQPGYPFEKIRAWQEAHRLALTIYRVSNGFPESERFGITNQLRRAATSVTANLAEGVRRATARDYAHFVNLAEGSMSEVKNFLILVRDLEYLPHDSVQPLINLADQICAMLYSLRHEILEHARQPKP